MPASSISATASPACSRWRATTTRATSSPIRARRPASAAYCATSSPWARGRSPASTRCRSARPRIPKTRHLVSGVVAGIGGYGNSFGVPTVGGSVRFHARYDGNCLVNAMAVGIARRATRSSTRRRPASACRSSISAPRPGATASMAPRWLRPSSTRTSDAKRPTVQVGDPFSEKLLLEACLEIMAEGLRDRHPGHGRCRAHLFGGGDGRQGRSRRHARS